MDVYMQIGFFTFKNKGVRNFQAFVFLTRTIRNTAPPKKMGNKNRQIRVCYADWLLAVSAYSGAC